MLITKATIADASELTALINSAYRGASSQVGWTSEAHLLGGIRIDEKTMTGYLSAPDTTILKSTDDSGKIIACVYLQEYADRQLYLGLLTVSPTLQAGGIGKQLLHEGESYASRLGCKTIIMTVLTARQELIDWYLRRGYRDSGRREPFGGPKTFGDPKENLEFMGLEKEL
jgi:predicted N-acetyltransferase YhbS